MRAISQALSKLRVKSALNPILWLCGIVMGPGIVVALTYKGGPPTWLLIVMFSPVAAAVLGFFYLLIADPGKLQSEDWQLRNQSLTMIGEKGYPRPISESSLIELVVNPDDGRPRIDEKRD